ncbi:DEAD/DEAH box helicase [Cohnella sp. GCM10020058]|uniref:DEAD/DEAH box helicase n=1 Tax=Cohnella sp. GCM10020058 TaxID=3317330 RepID=UPI00362B43F3
MTENQYYFSNITIEDKNQIIFDEIRDFANREKKTVYVINSPLAEKKYEYGYENAFALLIPGHMITFVNLGKNGDEFADYCEDFLEDLGHISDKYEYKEVLGRPRKWKSDYFIRLDQNDFDVTNLDSILTKYKIINDEDKRKTDLLISLLIGSINSIEKVGNGVPESILEKVKRKIVLFDSDQTRFIFHKVNRKRVTIQGLAGTGKTELLLHKLKELYTENNENKVAFTCFNKALANKLKSRVPEFFDFMKVEEQIKWEERLWVMHSWGSRNDKNNVGLYSYICKHYGLTFYRSNEKSLGDACKVALRQLEEDGNPEPCFDYILIDESQDFDDSFFELCEKVTRKTVYVAGDIFQNIFRDSIPDVTPNFLLNKCYRTEPKTLMFAHALGLGLFERPVLRWLTDDEWYACGYTIEKKDQKYLLSRNPLRRFEDVKDENIPSIELVETDNHDCRNQIIKIMKQIIMENPTVKPDDIAIVFVQQTNSNFDLMDQLSIIISNEFNWKSNIIHETKTNTPDRVFISNKNNIKGLEFPFVICVANYIIGEDVNSRNTLYMALTRSFITSYLIVSKSANSNLLPSLKEGLVQLNNSEQLVIEKPKENEILDRKILLRSLEKEMKSQRDIVTELFKKHRVPQKKHNKLRDMVSLVCEDSVEERAIERVIIANKDFMYE